jgi:hypothetical protein
MAPHHCTVLVSYAITQAEETRLLFGLFAHLASRTNVRFPHHDVVGPTALSNQILELQITA